MISKERVPMVALRNLLAKQKNPQEIDTVHFVINLEMEFRFKSQFTYDAVRPITLLVQDGRKRISEA